MDGVTIVICPLIALMVDQVRGLCERGIEAVLISSGQKASENTKILERLVGKAKMQELGGKTTKKNKKGEVAVPKEKEIKLVYCTPELVTKDRFRGVLTELYRRGKLALIAVDEAHCLSTWGHDFRTAYRELSWLRESFPDIPCIACTATATEKVISDIRKVLLMEDNGDVHISSFNRENIYYEVRYKESMTVRTRILMNMFDLIMII